MPFSIDRRTFLGTLAGISLLSSRGWAEPRRRLVTIGAPVTEIVYALGAGAEVVGTDTTSRYPGETAGLPKVGYMRTLSAEGLMSLSPTHLLAQDGSGPQNALDQVAALGVEVQVVPETPSVDGLMAKIRLLADKTGRQAAGEALTARLAEQFAAMRAEESGTGGLRGQPVLCLVHAGNGGPMAAGTSTVADAVIRLAGGRNAVADMEGYRPLSVEAAIAATPQILLVSHATISQAGGLDGFLAMPQVALTPAAQARRVAVLESAMLLGLGPRTPDAVRQLASAGAGT